LTPEELKSRLKDLQETLINQVLIPSGLKAYDPSTAPYSPDFNFTALPEEVYLVDSAKIVGARYFVGHHILASTGQGVEMEKAKFYNRIVVMLMDKKVRISRMQAPRAICLEYDNFDAQSTRFVEVFRLLQDYEPGLGFNDNKPCLLGFAKRGNEIVDLAEVVYEAFSDLRYEYDATVPILKFRLSE